MQNSYTKEGQFSLWLAPLWFHKGRGSNPLPFKTENYFNFYPGPLTSQRAQWPAPGWAMGLTPPGLPLETLTFL